MMLYEEGHFQLRDPISKWLPEFTNMQVAEPAPAQERISERYKLVPAARPITGAACSHPHGWSRQHLSRVDTN